MKKIESRTNPTIKQIAALSQKKHRDMHQQFIAEGLRTCHTLVQSGVQLLQLFALPEQVKEIEKFTPADKITLVSPSVMEKISASKSPSGILGQFAIPEAPNFDQLSPGFVLAKVADPGNMGTLIRTAAALNQKTVVAIEGCDPWSPKVVQSSAGTIGMVHIFQISWLDLVKHKKKLSLIALVVDGNQTIGNLKAQNNLLVVGSEAAGIPTEWVAQCDQTVTLPMPGGTESLNAAVAGSIALYLSYQNKETPEFL